MAAALFFGLLNVSVCLGLFSIPLGVTGRLYCVRVALLT